MLKPYHRPGENQGAPRSAAAYVPDCNGTGTANSLHSSMHLAWCARMPWLGQEMHYRAVLADESTNPEPSLAVGAPAHETVHMMLGKLSTLPDRSRPRRSVTQQSFDCMVTLNIQSTMRLVGGAISAPDPCEATGPATYRSRRTIRLTPPSPGFGQLLPRLSELHRAGGQKQHGKQNNVRLWWTSAMTETWPSRPAAHVTERPRISRRR